MTTRTSKRSLTTTDAAILGVLSWGAMSGYDVKKTVDSTVGYVWGPARSAIYAVLPRLVDDGLATARRSRSPSARTRSCTGSRAPAWTALKAWIEETPAPRDPNLKPASPQGFLRRSQLAGRARRPNWGSAPRGQNASVTKLDRFDAETLSLENVYSALTRAWGREYAAAVIRWARAAEAQLRAI